MRLVFTLSVFACLLIGCGDDSTSTAKQFAELCSTRMTNTDAECKCMDEIFDARLSEDQYEFIILVGEGRNEEASTKAQEMTGEQEAMEIFGSALSTCQK